MAVTAPDLAALDPATLVRRLHELAGDERRVQVDFLFHLAELDRREAFLDLGFGSLWDYCLKALHLREGAAGRRIGAMRVLRRFPRLEAPLRDGRLCLSTVALLGQVLTEENLDELVGRAAFLTKAEVDHLVASVRPRAAPQDGIRRIAEARAAIESTARAPERQPFLLAAPIVAPAPARNALPTADVAAGRNGPALPALAPPPIEPRSAPRVEVRAVSQDHWSLRVTLDTGLREDIETLRTLLSHKLPGGDLAEVLREAVRCGIEKHGRRRGAVAPARTVERPATSRAVESGTASAAVRREVWARDGGCCTYVAADGRRCESRWQLELDHADPEARGGPATAQNLRVRCRKHNLRYAEQIYGRTYMARFRRSRVRDTPTG